MAPICQILFPSRCGKCLSKVYCSQECLLQSWEGQEGGKGHKDFCSEAVDERKVKHTAKERRQAEKERVKDDYARYKEANKEKVGRETLKEVKNMCNGIIKSKKGDK